MPKTLRIGFIGSGGMTDRHTTVLADFKDTKLAAFCDLKKPKAAAMAEKFGAEAYTDPAKMLAKADLDALWINLPPFAHGEAEFAALEAQVPFFIEKPINKDIKQAANIAAAVEKAQLITCAGYMNRYQKSVETARAALQADPGVYAYGGWIGGVPASGDPNGIWGWWIQKDKSGGQFVEQVTHTMDLVRYLLGDAEAVSAFAARGFVKGIKHYSLDDALAVSVQFKSGAVGNFCASCASNARRGVFLDVYALNTAVKLEGWGHAAEIYQAGQKKPKSVASQSDIFAVEDRAFLKAVRTGNPAGIKTTYADALKTAELTVAATQSAENGGKAITLKYYGGREMADLLVRLYDLPPLEPALQRVRAQDLWVRRAEPWERRRVVQFAKSEFSENWADEIQMVFGHHPISLFVADDADGTIVGFAGYHCTRPDFFGPEGVMASRRGEGLGAALLLSCLWAMFHEGYAYAIIGSAGPVEFYQKVCGAIVIPDSQPGIYWPLHRNREL